MKILKEKLQDTQKGNEMQQALLERKGEERIFSSNILDLKIWDKIKGIEKDFSDHQITINEHFSQNKNLKQSVNN